MVEVEVSDVLVTLLLIDVGLAKAAEIAQPVLDAVVVVLTCLWNKSEFQERTQRL